MRTPSERSVGELGAAAALARAMLDVRGARAGPLSLRRSPPRRAAGPPAGRGRRGGGGGLLPIGAGRRVRGAAAQPSARGCSSWPVRASPPCWPAPVRKAPGRRCSRWARRRPPPRAHRAGLPRPWPRQPTVDALVAGVRALLDSMNDLFLRACRREPVERPPVWMMRQAGRYLPEYRAVRARADFLTMVGTPELAVEVTLQPVDLLGVDAAIIFSDILVIPQAMGMTLTVEEGSGPRFPAAAPHPGRRRPPSATSCRRRAWATCWRRCAWRGASSTGRVPLIGFAGAPWTLMSYMVEGAGSKSFAQAKRFLAEEPAARARAAEPAGAGGRRLPGGAGARRRAGGAGLRFLGERARPARLSRVRAALPGGGRRASRGARARR